MPLLFIIIYIYNLLVGSICSFVVSKSSRPKGTFDILIFIYFVSVVLLFQIASLVLYNNIYSKASQGHVVWGFLFCFVTCFVGFFIIYNIVLFLLYDSCALIFIWQGNLLPQDCHSYSQCFNSFSFLWDSTYYKSGFTSILILILDFGYLINSQLRYFLMGPRLIYYTLLNSLLFIPILY